MPRKPRHRILKKKKKLFKYAQRSKEKHRQRNEEKLEKSCRKIKNIYIKSYQPIELNNSSAQSKMYSYIYLF